MSNIGNKETLSKNLKYYIEKSGKDRRELSEIWGFPYSTVTEWINAKKYPRIDRIEIMADYFGILKSDLIEEKNEEHHEKKKNNDTAVDIVDILLDNPSVYPLVDRLLNDNEFLSLVKKLNELDAKKINGVSQMLDSFQ